MNRSEKKSKLLILAGSAVLLALAVFLYCASPGKKSDPPAEGENGLFAEAAPAGGNAAKTGIPASEGRDSADVTPSGSVSTDPVSTGSTDAGIASPGNAGTVSVPAKDSESTIDSSDNSDPGSDPPEGENDDMTSIEHQAAEYLKKMTLREKIYQMCIITPEQLGGAGLQASGREALKDALAEYPVGGVIFFEDHLQSPDQTRGMLSALQECAAQNGQLPLFLCVDEEGGQVARIAGNPAFEVKNVGPMADIGSADEAYRAGCYIGGYLSDLGFNVDFAPDADVLTAPGSVIIGDRSFGNDPKKVTEYAVAVSKGLSEQGIISCFKHYPGHGAVEADTHKGLAFTDKSLDDLMKCEMMPFIKAGENGIDMIMVAHISVPAILGDNTPCSLSEYMLTTVLKEKLGYNGLIITDALNMGAIVRAYSDENAAVMVVKAGADILLMPPNLGKAVSAIETAVQDGRINEENINASVKKILMKKLTLK